jgi:hypothetical protein
MSEATRGERNNNPGNIDFHPSNAWHGQLGLELDHAPARFARFDCAENGIRALAKILLHYDRAEHLETVRAIVSKWAPAIENDSGSYVADLDRRLGIAADDRLDLADPAILGRLVTGIIIHENGHCIYDAATIAEGVRRALPQSEATASA